MAVGEGGAVIGLVGHLAGIPGKESGEVARGCREKERERERKREKERERQEHDEGANV